MGIYEKSDILAYSLTTGELICADCITDDDEFTEDGIMTERDFDDERIYFCDRDESHKIWG